jgi:hypothetical protein
LVGEFDRENEVRSKVGDPEMSVLKIVSHFNYGLGRLYLLVDLLVSLRDADIILRREKFKQMRADRLNSIDRKRVRSNKMQEEMREAEIEDGENFNQIEWIALFNENNPEVEIPEEPKRDTDLDYDPVDERSEQIQDAGDALNDDSPQDQPADGNLLDDANKDPQ